MSEPRSRRLGLLVLALVLAMMFALGSHRYRRLSLQLQRCQDDEASARAELEAASAHIDGLEREVARQAAEIDRLRGAASAASAPAAPATPAAATAP